MHKTITHFGKAERRLCDRSSVEMADMCEIASRFINSI